MSSLIGISGKMGSGKDTLGSIIQYLTWQKEIDNSITTYDQYLIGKPGGYSGVYEIKKFAGKLKQIASLLTGISIEKFENQEFKDTYLEPEWGTIKDNPLNSIPVFKSIPFNHLMSIRELLQKLGTDAMRNGLHENVWTNALFADYIPKELDKKGSLFYPNWIITDVRFPNELKAVKDRNGVSIRIIRPDLLTNPITGKSFPIKVHKKEHISETALDEAEFDYVIYNNSDIQSLIEKVRIILKENDII